MATYRRNVAGTLRVPSARHLHALNHSPYAITAHGVCLLRAFTLVEMLIAMAITLVMMAAVVTLFANVSDGVRNRRATIEMSNQLRSVRNTLQQDLQGATCPGLTWQRPESNHGYIEVIEGLHREGNASHLINGVEDPLTFDLEINHTTSILPSSNLPFTSVPGQSDWATDGAGLGDYDDVLMLTVRNEHEPFVGRTPADVGDVNDNDGDPDGFAGWGYETISSTLAEVVWFAIENPEEASNTGKFFGEPGMRTIYRRTLLIAPWVNPYKVMDGDGDGIVQSEDGTKFKVVPGLVRLLPKGRFGPGDLARVFAALIAFQDRYDLSVRAEWDPHIEHWKLVANTLSDLTKRENRFGHFGFFRTRGSNAPLRVFPYAAVSLGSDCNGNTVTAVVDPEIGGPAMPAEIRANITDLDSVPTVSDIVKSYRVTKPGDGYLSRPFVYVDEDCLAPATAQAMLNDEGKIIRVVHGPVPLWGDGRNGTLARRGQDVMMSDVLAFDLRVYDPGAPLFGHVATSTVISPGDVGWMNAYMSSDNMKPNGSGAVGNSNRIANVVFPYVSQGAYVDLGYGFNLLNPSQPELPFPVYHSDFASSADPWFFVAQWLPDVFGNALSPGFSVYDTWSFHYENNGVNEDADVDALGNPLIDEGTDGLEGVGHYSDGDLVRLGVDDVGERETVPPYDKPLRGMQVIIRTYERDARSIRQIRVNQHFMLE